MNFKYAWRSLARTPGFATIAILTLALCIGANSAIFSVVDRVLLRRLPYPEPERLAQVVTTITGRSDVATGQTGAVWEALRDDAPALDVAAVTQSAGSTGVNLAVGDRAEYVREQRVSAGYFRVLGVPLLIGREFTQDEDRAGGANAVVISYGLWQQMFAGSPTAVGQSVTLRGEPHIITGVMPDSFTGPSAGPVDVWTPVRACATCEGGGLNYSIIGRLAPGATWAEANAQVERAADAPLHLVFRSPAVPRGEIIPLHAGQTQDVRTTILVLWAAGAVVLLIGCVNVAGLLVARASTRSHEIAMRIALGASNGAIVRQLMAESVLLAAAGGIGGLLIGDTIVRAFPSLLSDAFAVTGNVALDGRVVAIGITGALATSLLFGLLPAIDAARVDLRGALIESASPTIAGHARRWPRQLMIIVQVALSVTLVIGAGLLLRTLDHLLRQKAGFDGTHVTAATLSLDDARYRTSGSFNRLVDRSLERIHAIPGVEHAAVALTLPYERALNQGGRWVGGDRIPIMNMTYVTPEYFELLRVPVVRGRSFTTADGSGAAAVIVVNQAFARRYSAALDPMGRQIAMAGTPRTVVGIVGDVEQKAMWGNFGPVGLVPEVYIPAAQTTDAFITTVHAWFSPSWLVRTSIAEQGLALQIQSAMQAVDPTLPFATFRTLDDVRGAAVAAQRAQSALLGAFAALALLLTGLGLYGLVATTVATRVREIGIRAALGATPGRAVLELVRPSMLLALAGGAAGVLLAAAAAGTLRRMVWGISATDPITFVAAAAVVLLVALVASAIPAMRVSRLDPVRAIREGAR